jgi:hypothetical protein
MHGKMLDKTPALKRRPAAMLQRSAAAAASAASTPSPARALQQRLGNQRTQALVSRTLPAVQAAAGTPLKSAVDAARPMPAATAQAAMPGVTSGKAAPTQAVPGGNTPGVKPAVEPGSRPSAARPAAAKAVAATSEAQSARAPVGPTAAKTPTTAPAPDGKTGKARVSKGAIPKKEADKGTAIAIARTPAGRSGAGDRGAPAESIPIDTTSSEGLLQSLRHVPASRLGESVQKAGAALPQIQAQEKTELQASYPVIERPTGLPRRAAKHKAATTHLSTPSVPEPEQPGGREGQPPNVKAPEPAGPVPGSMVSTHVVESATEDESSWWDRLVNRLQNFFGSLPITDSDVDTSAGERPQVDTTGEADPTLNTKSQQAATEKVGNAQSQADAATTANFGENDIYPSVPGGKMRPRYKPGPASAARIAGVPGMPSLPPEAQGAFDQKAAPWLDGKVGEQVDRYQQEQDNYRQKSEETREEGIRQIAEATESARQEQEGLRGQARGEVAAKREAWQGENQLIRKEYADKSEAKRKETDEQIQTKVRESEQRADNEMTKAEAQAVQEKRKAEEKAAEEKRKEESKPRSWWDKVKGAISAVFEAIKKVVTAIFDALRWAVRKIIQGVKALVRGIIELARLAVVGLIKAYGFVLKGLVSIALIAFPKAAAKARAAIDAAVDKSVDAVNSAAEWLKSKTDAILDWVGNVLDKALGFLQTVVTMGLEVMRLLATGQFKELWEKLKNLGKSAWEGLKLVEGYMWEGLIGFDITKPLGPQLAGGGEEGTPAPEGSTGAPENLDFFLQERIHPDQFLVQPMTELEVDEELLSHLTSGGGQPLQSEPAIGSERGLEGAKAELLGHLPQEQASAGPQQVEEGGAMADPKMQAIIERAIAAKTPAERIVIIKDLMIETIKSAAKKYWEEKIKPNLYWIIPAVIVALAAFIAAEVLTGGAITGAIPIIMEIVGAAFIAQAVVKIAEGMGVWLEKGWAGDISGAAKGFGKGYAGALIELLTALLMEIGGAALRATLKGLGKVLKLAMRGAKALGSLLVRGGKGLVKGILYVGKFAIKAAKVTGSMITRAGKFLLEKGKLIFQGLKKGFAKGIKTVEELWIRLKQWFSHFTGFSAQIEGEYLVIYADFNPRRPVARIKLQFQKLAKSVQTEIKGIAKTERKLIVKAGGVFEKIATKATDAKDAVERIASKLASKVAGVFGKPDNIRLDAKGLIREVEEVKFYGKDTLKELGELAEKSPARFVERGFGQGKHIQIGKHVETIEAIRGDPQLIAGTVVKGVSQDIKYVVTLPKFAGGDLKAVEDAVLKMKKAWSEILKVDVTVRYGSHSTTEILDITKVLAK